MSVKEVSDGGLKKELEHAGDKVVLVDFYATWCGPCKMVAPTIDELSKSHPNAVFLKIDVEKCETESQQYKITAMPTFLFFQRMKELERIQGANVDAIRSTLAKYYKETLAFSGEGHSMLDNTQSTASAHIPSSSSNIEAQYKLLEKVAQQRFGTNKQNETMTTIRLRFPDIPSPINIRLSTDQTLMDVRHLICSTIISFQTNPFEFMQPPAMKLNSEDESKTIREAKLMNAVLAIKKLQL